MTLLELEQMEKFQKHFDCSKIPTEKKIFVVRVGKNTIGPSHNYLIVNKLVLNLWLFSASLWNLFAFLCGISFSNDFGQKG